MAGFITTEWGARLRLESITGPAERLPKLTFRQVEVFRATMVAGTVNGAASLLRTSQPVLTRTLRRMEDVVGVPLFHRIKGRLIPTSEAKLLFEHVDRLHKQLAGLDQVLERMGSGDGQVFRLGSSPSIARRLVPAALARIRARHPALRFHLDVLSISQMPDYLSFGHGECVMTIFPMNHPLIETRRLGDGHLVCLIPEGHRLARKSVIMASDLVDVSFVAFDDDTPHGQLVAQLFANGEPRPLKSIGVRFAETALNLVATGLGIAVVDEFSAMGTEGLPIVVRPIKNTPTLGVHLNCAAALSSHFVMELERDIRAIMLERSE